MKRRIGRECIAGSDPARPFRQRNRLRRMDADRRNGMAIDEECAVDLVHASIEAGDHLPLRNGCSDGIQRANRQHGDSLADRQTLCRSTGHAQAGKRPRTGTEGDCIEIAEAEARLGHQLGCERQQGCRRRRP